MKKKLLVTLVTVVFLSVAGFIFISAIEKESVHDSNLKSMGGPPYNTNAPGEKTCSGVEGTSPCHSGGIPDNTGPATYSITSSGGTMYVPGTTYTITASITHATRTRFGFQLTARRLSNNSNTGNLTVPVTDTSLMWTQFPGYGSCQTCEFIMHKKAGTYFASTTGQWKFTWTAPSSNAGNIRLYACFNAADNSNTETGDEIYFTTLTLTPSATGINEQEPLSSSINIFPNPTSGVFNVWMSKFENVQIEVYNLFGECIYQHICTSAHQQINLGEARSGIYFLKISSGDKTAVKKVIVE